MNVTDRRLRAARGDNVLLAVELGQPAHGRAPHTERIRDQAGTLPVCGGSGLCREAGEPPGIPNVCGTRRSGTAELHDSLEALKHLYCTHTGMEPVLQTASRLVVEIVNLEHCSIGWFEGHEFAFRVRASHTREGAEVNPQQPARALSDFAWKGRPKHGEYARPSRGFGSRRDSVQANELTAPLRLDRQIVGYLYGLRSRLANPRSFDADRSLFVTLSEHISAAIEAQRAREMLDCAYVGTALDAQERLSFLGVGKEKSGFLDSVKNPEDLVRRIGRGLFGDLHRAGFETKQLVSVATQIIDSLNEVLRTAKS